MGKDHCLFIDTGAKVLDIIPCSNLKWIFSKIL